jgi:hypothetical protein
MLYNETTLRHVKKALQAACSKEWGGTKWDDGTATRFAIAALEAIDLSWSDPHWLPPPQASEEETKEAEEFFRKIPVNITINIQ